MAGAWQKGLRGGRMGAKSEKCDTNWSKSKKEGGPGFCFYMKRNDEKQKERAKEKRCVSVWQQAGARLRLD